MALWRTSLTKFLNRVHIHIQPLSGLCQYKNNTVGFTHGYSHSIPSGFKSATNFIV